jgi:hypothetical protein
MTDEIPAGVSDICSGVDSYPAKVTEHTCKIDFHGLELRFQVDNKGQWVWDEVVGECRLHIEQMDMSYYWLGIHPLAVSGKTVHINIGAKRAPVTMQGWVE